MMTTERKRDLPFIIFFVLFLITGLSIYRDYGVSWDEPISRDSNGILNYDFIRTGNPEAVIKGNEKYHGPAFEIALVIAEKIIKPTDFRQTYFLRHLLTFIVFAVSILFFYKLCIKYFKDEWLALTAVAFLVLSPRIFADAFYNSKDLALLSFTIISIYTTINFIEKN